ncbi:MAG: TrmH family RNA methyltransferase [Nanoarchaeota archaeon]
MKYLLILNKFELSKERLKDKIKAELNDSKFYEDNGLILGTQQDINKILFFEEIEKILPLYLDWKKLDFKTFKQDFNDLNIKTHLVKVKFLSKIPISTKSIIKKVNSALKQSRFSEHPEKVIYLEIIKKEKPYYRIFIIPYLYWEKFKMGKDKLNVEVVLENPEDKEEIKDFLRLCYIFNLPLNILTNKNINNLIDKAKEEAKGIPYEKFILDINKKLEGIKIGFSINSKLDEQDFKKFYNENKNKKILLIFGNEKFGLTQELRDKLDFSFRLTKETKKPLRSSHSLSYVLGLLN